jgi:hypothetical protein
MWRTLPLVLLLLASSCSQRTGVSPPQAPQISVANYVNLLAQSLPAASSAIIAARDGGKLSSASAREAQDVIVALATTGKRINVILRSGDPWETQRILILTEIISSGASEAARRLPPEASALLTGSLTLLNQILAGVGGAT